MLRGIRLFIRLFKPGQEATQQKTKCPVDFEKHIKVSTGLHIILMLHKSLIHLPQEITV